MITYIILTDAGSKFIIKIPDHEEFHLIVMRIKASDGVIAEGLYIPWSKIQAVLREDLIISYDSVLKSVSTSTPN